MSLLWLAPGLLLLGYLAFLVALTLGQRRVLYKPDRVAPDAAEAGVPGLQVLRAATDDGLALLAWYVPPARPGGCVVLYFHGNNRSIGSRADRLRDLAAVGWGVLMQEYRGYGGNPGAPSEDGLMRDARAGLALLLARGIGGERILLWGESLGSGVAVRLASERAVAAVLLESPYTSIAAIARARYRLVPVDLLLRDRFDSLACIGGVRAPVLVMQGALDDVVPPAMGRALMAAATAPKRLWVAPDAGHFDIWEAGALAAAVDFVRAHGLCAAGDE